MDPNIKEYPNSLVGRGFSGAVGVCLKRSFSLDVTALQNSASGPGNWKDVGGIDPAEAAYQPVATGNTAIRMRGLRFDMRNTFRVGKFHPFVEAGVGAGTLKVNFKGTVAAIDPTDGQSFTVDATDVVRRYIPIGTAGVGMEFPLRSGIIPWGGYWWEMGSKIAFGVKYFPFHRPQ